MRLPFRTLGLAIAALFLGSALAPVSAQQQQSGVDGQVAVRASDGALYLIINGQRRWVATVVASDEEINAIPEGAPLYSGLAPPDSTIAVNKPTTQQSSASSKPNNSSSGSRPSSDDDGEDDDEDEDQNDNEDDEGSDDDELSDDIPIDISLDGSTTFEPGESRVVEIKTESGVTCELTVDLPGDDEDITEDSKNADSDGECRYTIEIPDDVDEGEGTLTGTVREGGKVNREEIDIEIEED